MKTDKEAVSANELEKMKIENENKSESETGLLCDNMYITIRDASRDFTCSDEFSNLMLDRNYIHININPYDTLLFQSPGNISEIYDFCELLSTLQKQEPDKKILFHADAIRSNQIRWIFLVGCYVVLKHDYSKALEVLEQYKHSLDIRNEFGELSLEIFWRALDGAKQLKWIGLVSEIDQDDDAVVNIQECVHYSRSYAPQSLKNQL
jgi:hypothetical protein